MPISESHVGRVYPATEPYVVSAAKVHEFAAALQDDSPAYTGSDPIAPPTFAMVIGAAAWGALFSDPELGLELRRTVHGEQRFDWDRPLRTGDAVTGTLSITKFRARGATEMITIAVEVATTEGERICTATSTLIHNREVAA
ncbi:FAS1-like dehydratase domain-containing protein [Propionicicella superfundia]|uniref:FAS1-like dehydratase domain-containing protein n=1 Tax=Propionicicella superfundia TaxID=348582 RepID=UPI000408B85D|nr:MaoC family dehydratase N-terminal domain-containing protein [Propionicicella superfundia]